MTVTARHRVHHCPSNHPARHRGRVAIALGASVLLPTILVADPVSAGASAVATASPSSSVTGLAVGSTGPAVRDVQQALIDAGVEVIGGADGIFGPMTAAALRSFQTQHGLESNGVVTEATAIALGLLEPTAVSSSVTGLAVGSTGPAVRDVQQALIDAGVEVIGGADGIFGPMTAAALRSFQTQHGLESNGVVTEATARVLFSVGDTPARQATNATAGMVGLRAGAVGTQVRTLQEALIASGLTFVGGADGIFGPATANALRVFQSRRGLPVTGEVDAVTAEALANPTAIAVVDAATGGSATANRSVAGLAPGAVGPQVRALQEALIAAGLTFAGGADGVFGPATANALKEFQRRNGISVTGRVDAATEAALASPRNDVPAQAPSNPTPTAGNSPADSSFPVFGERSERVRTMQRLLQEARITVPGGADGIFGSQTAGAIMTFQREQGLAVTGQMDATTANRLGLQPSTAPAAPSGANIRMEVFPVEGPCSFADTWHFPRGGGRVHEGTDVIASIGKEIYAVVAGEITQIYHDRPGSRSGNGLRLTQPDGTYFFYAHLDRFADGIEVGTKVSAGQLLGYNGDTGNAGTPHLHFEIHPGGGAAINPYPFLRQMNGCRR